MLVLAGEKSWSPSKKVSHHQLGGEKILKIAVWNLAKWEFELTACRSSFLVYISIKVLWYEIMR